MFGNVDLKRYLIRAFLLTILIVGVAQSLVSTFFNDYFTVIAEKYLGMNGLFEAHDIKGTYWVILQGLLIFVMQNVGNFFSSGVFSMMHNLTSYWFNNQIVDMITQMSETMTIFEIWGYFGQIFLFSGCILLVWLSPYIIGAYAFSKIVTKKLKELEEIERKEHLEYDRKRNLLISDIAHDIKTPITTVAGFSKALAEGAVEAEHSQEYLNAIYLKSMQISELITYLFEYVKLDSVGYALHMQKVDFAELVRECIGSLYADFESHNMELDIDIPEESLWIWADKMQMTRAINNLFNNTIRHNPDGTKVFVDMSLQSNLKFGRQIVFHISDLGVKIDSDLARDLFEPFVQGDYSRKTGKGSGLGLSITKKLIEMHKGAISLIQYGDSTKHNKVKTFEIILPAYVEQGRD